MKFLVIIGFRNVENQSFPITRELHAQDEDDAEKFLKEQKIEYFDICKPV